MKRTEQKIRLVQDYSPDMVKRIDKLCEQQERPRAVLIRIAVREYLEKHGF